MEDVNKKWISGFWRRIGAAFIDVIILFVVGLCLGLFFGDVFAQIGDWGKLVGFIIAILYFGVMNSYVTGGQTFGKMILNIKVVDAAGQVLTLPKSFLRYSVIGIPYFLNGLSGTEVLSESFLIYPFSMIVLGGLFSIAYLYVFNRMTRQSLHDLVVGSYVVNVNAPVQSVSPIWKPHFVIVGILCLLSAALPSFTNGILESQGLAGLRVTQAAINQHPAVRNSGVMVGSTTVLSSDSGNKTVTFVNVTAQLKKRTLVDSEDLARQFAKTLVDTFPEAKNKDVIHVTLIYGYNIGIASSTTRFSHRFDTAELNANETK